MAPLKLQDAAVSQSCCYDTDEEDEGRCKAMLHQLQRGGGEIIGDKTALVLKCFK